MSTSDAVWRCLAQDPGLPGHAGLRASDADREVVRAIVNEAYAAGRLSRAEHDERVTGVLTAVLLADLEAAVADLVPAAGRAVTEPLLPAAKPAPEPAPGPVQGPTDWLSALAEVLVPGLICTGIWWMSGLPDDDRGFFWPGVVVAATVLHVLGGLLVGRHRTSAGRPA